MARALSTEPDLVVRAVNGAPSTTPGNYIPVELEVCNDGGGLAHPSQVDLVLSTDDVIDDSDITIENMMVPDLPAGACASMFEWVPTPGTPGTFVLGAIADATDAVFEADEGNNAAAGGTLALGHGPDLYVASVSQRPSLWPQPGYVEAEILVCNQGTAPAFSTDVDLVLSTDEEIGLGDAFVGSSGVGYLDPLMCQSVEIFSAAGVPAGGYVLGAIVDAYDAVVELREDNNAGAGPRVAVGDGPDLEVVAVSAPPSASPYGDFTTTVRVCNRGQGWTYASAPVIVVLSPDDDISHQDEHAGWGDVPSLPPSACAEVSVMSHASSQGLHVLGAIVDAGPDDIIADNNALAGGHIGIGYGPDLAVASISAPPTASPYGDFEAVVEVCNHGDVPSSGAYLDLYLSADEDISPMEDAPVGWAEVPYLLPGGCTELSMLAWAMGDTDAPVVGAIVQGYGPDPEVREDNNVLAGERIGIGHGPDLAVVAVNAPPTAAPHEHFEVEARVCNHGQDTSYWTDVQIFLSFDAELSRLTDIPAGWADVPELAPGACVDVDAEVYAGMFGGPRAVLTLGAIVDPFHHVQELREDNNAFVAGRIGIGDDPDLAVVAVSGSPTAAPYDDFEARVQVCNQGQSPSHYEWVELYLSLDDDISPMDHSAGWADVPPLSPGACVELTTQAHAPDEGIYVLGAIVGPYGAPHDLLPDNNVLAGGRIGVGHEPDMIVRAISAPPTAAPYDDFEARVQVCNQGQSPSHYEWVDLYLSLDENISPMDHPAGWADVPPLSPGACVELTTQAYAPDEGIYVLGAIVGPYGAPHDLLPDNNTFAGGRIGVGHEPDLAVVAVDGPATASPHGDFEVQVEVCNQGQSQSYGDHVEVFLSVDENISPIDYPAGWADVPPLAPGACVELTAQSYPPSEGIYVLGAILGPYGLPYDMIADNNVLAGERIAVTTAADLAITALDGPATAAPHGDFEVQVEVCNQGQSQSYGDHVEVFLSVDENISPIDYPAGWADVPPLAPGACADLSVQSYPPSEGVYVLGAIVGPHGAPHEPLPDDNVRAGGRIAITTEADLAITALRGPATASPHESFEVQVQVCNQGQSQSYGEYLDVFLSVDANISPMDHPAGWAEVPALAPGACADLSVQSYPPGEGVYVLGAIVGPYGAPHEPLPDDNVRAGGRITITS